MNIDTVKFIIDDITNNGMSLKFDTTTHMDIRLPGKDEIVKTMSNRRTFEGVLSNHNIAVRHEPQKDALHIEGSLYGYLFGQNVYTSSNLRWLVLRTIAKLRKDLPFDLHHKEDWIKGMVELIRVDIANNFRFLSDELVLKILRQLKLQMAVQDVDVSLKGTSVCWQPRNGTGYSIRFYGKGPQMAARKDVTDDDLKKLVKECKGVLRIELRLNHSELKLLGLNRLDAWKKNTARKLFYKYFHRIPILNVTTGPFIKEDYDALPKKIRHAFLLHKAGYDLRDLYSKGHYSRLRKEFKDLGLDSYCPNQKDSTVELRDIFSKEKIARPSEELERSKLRFKRKTK